MLGRARFVVFAATMAAGLGCERSRAIDVDAGSAPATWDDVDDSDGDATPVWSADRAFVAVAGVVLRASDGARVMSFDGVPIAFDASGSALAVAPTPSQAEAEAKIDVSQPLRAATGFSIVTAGGVRVTKPDMRFRGWAPKGSAYLVSEAAQTLLAVDGTDRLVPLNLVGVAAGRPAFDPTGALVLFAARNSVKLVVVDAASGEERSTFTLPHAATSFGWIGDRVWACGEQDDMVFFAPVSDPSNAVAVDMRTPAPRPGATGPAGPKLERGPGSCAAPPHASALVTEAFGRATLLDPKDGAVIVHLDAKKPLSRPGFDATGSHAVFALPDEGVALVDIAQRSVLRLPGRAARFHPEKPLVLLETESSVEVREAAHATVVASFRGSLSPFRDEDSFSSGAMVATAHDGALTLWDLDRAAPRVSIPIERTTSSSGKPESAARWTWNAPTIGPAFASFVRRRTNSADVAKELEIQDVVFVRVADGARLLMHAVADGPRLHGFAYTERGAFDADDAVLAQVFLRSGADHIQAAKLAHFRRPGLVEAFFRGERLPP